MGTVVADQHEHKHAKRHPERQRGSHISRSVLALYVRLTRRGALFLALGAATYVVIESVAFEKTYPDAASRATLVEFVDEPAVRMLQGIPHAVDTVGGFVVWDGGWFLQAAVGIWALITVGRWLRGEEDTDRGEWVAVQAIRKTRAVVLATLAVILGCMLTGAAVVASAFAGGGQLLGSVLFGFAVAGFGATFAALSAVTSQVFDGRRQAVGVAAAGLGAAFLLRMVANSQDSLAWVGWLTPYSWLDKVRAFGDNNWAVLGVYVLATAALLALAVALRARRDTGAGLVTANAAPPSHLRLLRSPMAFAWRTNRGVLLAWVVGLTLYAAVMGAILKTMTDFLAEDENYRRILEQMGMDEAGTDEGFLGVMGVVFGLVFVLYVVWRVAAARTEESSQRLENLLTRPVHRWRWLGGHVLLAAMSATLLVLVSGAAIWVGAAPTGAEVSLAAAVASTANTLPIVALFGGLAVAIFGAVPRLTVIVPVAMATVAYVLELLGPALELPDWVVAVSPFHHLAYVPAQPFLWGPGLVMAGLGVLGAVVGLVAFERRDLVGS